MASEPGHDAPRSHIARRRFVGALATSAASALVSPAAFGQNQPWPPGAVTVIVPFPAGAATDVQGRIVFDRVSQVWGVPVIIDNKGGGNGVLAAQAAARAKPDGLTLFLTSAMTQAANPALYEGKLPYDPIRDFVPIGRFTPAPFFVLVRADSPVRTLAELTALLKGEPGRHNFGAGSVPARVASELYRLLAGVEVTHVGYRSNPQAWPDLINGQLTYMCVDPTSSKPQIDRGALRALAVTAAERQGLLPDVPTTAEAGMPAFVLSTWVGLYAPRGTPADIIDRINRDVAAAMQHPPTRARLEALGSPPSLTTPAELVAFGTNELERWGNIIRRAGMKAE